MPIEARDEISIERFAGDIQKTLKNAQISKAVFAGCSMGGYVLFELWRQAPHVVAGLIFADTRAEADTEETAEKRRELIEKMREVGTVDLPDIAAGYLSDHTRETKPAVERDVRAWAAEPPCELIIRSVEMLINRPNSVPTLATIDVPTLVLVGEEDKVTPPDAAAVIADSIKDARLATIPDAGHLSPLENPAAVNAAIAQFLPTIS